MIEWWPHQKTGLQKLAMAIAEGETRICLACPTGGGKTQMAKAQLLKLPRSVFYTHREILFDQTSEKFMEDEIPHGLRASGKDTNHDNPIQLAMIQSEYNAAVKGMRRTIHNANQIIIDEAHNNREAMMQALIDAHDCVTIGLTATPLGIGHIYDKLIIAGTNRELRECGAHCPARHYAPPEPDFLEVSGEVKIGGETGIRKTKRSQFATMVYADVVEHYKRLNPEQKPTILFAPGVAESIWFAQELSSIGIPSAHIDGEDVWVDGQMYDKSKAKVDEIEQRCKAGEIKIVCNRFVLREGVDWPFIHHGIFATVFGSLTSYLQAGGRIIRNHPSMDHCCVARGTLILTDRGEVPIQEVKTTDLVWDGVEFVKHGGAVCNDTKEVIEWEGLLLTSDHKVLTQNGWKEAEEAKASSWGPVVSGIGGRPIWTADDSNPYDPRQRGEVRGRGRLFEVWRAGLEVLSQNFEAYSPRLRALHEYVWGSLPGMALASSSASAPALPMPSEQYVPPIWRARHRVPFFVNIRGCLLDRRKSWVARRFKNDLGSDRQRRTLRARKFKMGDSKPANVKPWQVHSAKFEISSILKGIPVCYLWQGLSGPPFQEGINRRTNSGALEKEVWDIVNCGPRNRYTANGVVVGNCIQDHGGNFWRHGSLNLDRGWRLELTNEIAYQIRRERHRTKKDPQPIVCPECFAVRLRGKVCHECKFRYEKRTRPVRYQDGRLKQVAIKEFRPKRYLDDNAKNRKDWESLVWAVRKSKKPSCENRTFSQLAGKIAYDNYGRHPSRDWPMMPVRAIDFYLPVKSVPVHELIGYKRKSDCEANQ